MLPPAGGLLSLVWVAGTFVIRGNVFGGSTAGAVLLGNGPPSAFPTILQGNFVGTDATGTVDLGNAAFIGIELDTTDVIIGGANPGEGNVIAFNGTGVYVGDNALRCTIRGNSIYSNGRLSPYMDAGIRFPNPNAPLDYYTPFPNDLLDLDSGPNGLQNFPIISSAVSSGAEARRRSRARSTARRTRSSTSTSIRTRRA
jgi:hypothetical protein